jgi:hypothetical protein
LALGRAEDYEFDPGRSPDQAKLKNLGSDQRVRLLTATRRFATEIEAAGRPADRTPAMRWSPGTCRPVTWAFESWTSPGKRFGRSVPPICPLWRREQAHAKSEMTPDLRFCWWGGLDSNQRPTDYEFDRERFGDQAKRSNIASEQGTGYPRLLVVSQRFAVDRGTHAGHVCLPPRYIRCPSARITSPTASRAGPGSQCRLVIASPEWGSPGPLACSGGQLGLGGSLWPAASIPKGSGPVRC